jgi:hypothetical protein
MYIVHYGNNVCVMYVKDIKEETAGGGPTGGTVPLSLLVAMSAGHVNHRERDQFMIPGITVSSPPPSPH